VLTAAALALTALVAGLTGAWSPCGFSMVETLGSALPLVGRRVVQAASATFALGALAGGALTFGILGGLSALLGAGGGGGVRLAAAVGIALLAALGEALGVRVVPQIRRQVPEPWRRGMPLPLAAGLYGILLGLGFTTFVLTLAVWALAGIAVALGSPAAGLIIGLGFGLGRALPVVVMAPRYATLGERLEIRMAEQPHLLRRLRLADAALLAALATALVTTGAASAARLARVATGATDPTYAQGALAWKQLDGHALIEQGTTRTRFAADNVALGGPYLALRTGGVILVRDRASGATVAQVDVQRASQLAVSSRWLVWRETGPRGGDRLLAVRLPGLGRPRVIAGGRAHVQIGRPALSRDRLVFAVATARSSSLIAVNLATGARSTVRRSTLTQLSQPALRNGSLLYVEADYCTQRLVLVRLHAPHRQRRLLRIGSTAPRDAGRDPGHTTQGSEPSRCPPGTPPRTDTLLWSTALAPGAAYVTLLRPSADAGVSATLARVRA
jgi:hypothetical protein